MFILRKGVWRPQFVPAGPVALIENHPLAPQRLYAPGVKIGDVAGIGPAWVPSPSSPPIAPGYLGPASYHTSNQAWQVGTGPLIGGLSAWTVAGLVQTTAPISNVGRLFYAETTKATGNDILKIGMQDTANGSQPTFGLVYRNDAGHLTNGQTPQTAPVINDGKPHMCVITNGGGSLNNEGSPAWFDIFIDGVHVFGENWFSQGYSFTNSGIIQTVGNDVSDTGANWLDGFIYGVWVYTRALAPSEIQHLGAEPFAMLRPRTVRRYYAVTTSAGNTLTISGGIGPIGAGFIATQSQAAVIAPTAGPVAAAVAAAQSQSATLAGSLGSVGSAITATQSNPATLAATTGAVSTTIAASQSQSASVSAAIGPVAAFWSVLQSQTAEMAGTIGPVASAWQLTQTNIATMAIAAIIGPVAAAITAAQSQSAAIVSTAGPVASAWTITQANIVSMTISAALGPISAAVSATQSQAVSVAATAPRVASAWALAQSQGMTISGASGAISGAVNAVQSQTASGSASIGPIAAAWQATQTNIATLAISATLGIVSASLVATQSQIAQMQAAIGPVSGAFSAPSWVWGYDTYLTVTIQPISRVVSIQPISRSITITPR